jgi:RNA polymerase sigma-70 factor (ECF subfamily)
VSLLQRCKDDDQTAWRELFRSRVAQIYRWAVVLGLGPAEAEDATQDVLATAARRIHTCAAEEVLTSWLYQITRRVVANRRRNRWIRRWLPGQETYDRAADRAAFAHGGAGELAFELEARRCLDRMPAELRELLVMVEIVGLTRAEAARALGLPEGTVASRLRKARALFLERWHRGAEGVTVTDPLEEVHQ